MPAGKKLQSEAWLQSPLRTVAGTLQHAGRLENITGIDPAAMRVLGSYALVLLVAGNGYYADANGQNCRLEAGDAVFVFPELAHAYGGAAGADWAQVYFVFEGPTFDLWRKQSLLKPERSVWRLGAPEYWEQRLRDILPTEGAVSTGRGAGLRALGRFLDVLAEMLAADEASAQSHGREAWYESSLQRLGHGGAHGWPTPQAVAREVGLSYENFRKRFAQLSGEAPGQYQKRRKLEWACAAIYQGEHSMKAIADELGFCDVFHFSKAFKLVVGTTPSEYRRRVIGR